jgi:hypothetical protein
MSMILDGSNGVTFNDASLQGAAASPYVLKNRIINGDMRIDQRNAGASVSTSSGTEIYTLDRWQAIYAQTSKYTIQQDAGAVTPPVGFNDYLGVTSSSAYSVLSADYFSVRQKIEGYNIADLGWGTASAKTITLSFWVRSSLTGTFGGALVNGGETRSYPFSYTVSTANTWTQISITIAGDTSGTWLTTNGQGVQVRFGLGSGATFSGTSGAWAAANIVQPSSTVSVVGTNGATWYITGVQLEVGSTATPFERRLYNQELANCQRYYIRYVNGTSQIFGNGDRYASTGIQCTTPLQTEMRIAPSLVASTGSGYYIFSQVGTDHTFNSLTINSSTTSKVATTFNSGDTSATAGQPGLFKSNNASSSIAFNAEL